jgi:hypothetical protein
MPFQRPTRPLSVLASAVAAVGLMLAAASCSNITPLGPDPAPLNLPPARDLGSPIIMQVMRSQPPTPAGKCPAGSIALFGSEPDVPRAMPASVAVDALGLSVAGKLWQAPQTRRRFNALRAEQINLLSRQQALQLYRLLVPSG